MALNHFMLDLETMSNDPNAAIVAIGAVQFDPYGKGVESRFYKVVNLTSNMGGHLDPRTIMWWMQQSNAARQALFEESVSLSVALDAFTYWLSGIDSPVVWGNGAGFDNVVLSSAYKRCAKKDPWKYHNNRCYRTMKNLYPEIELIRVGEHHHALDDAESQALHLQRIFEELAK